MYLCDIWCVCTFLWLVPIVHLFLYIIFYLFLFFCHRQHLYFIIIFAASHIKNLNSALEHNKVSWLCHDLI